MFRSSQEVWGSHLVVKVLHAEALPQVPEHLRTVLLELEVAWKVFSVRGGHTHTFELLFFEQGIQN